MPKLVFTGGGKKGEWELGSFLLAIGRHPDNNIVLDDKQISAHHAVVGFAQGRHYIEDLRSTNGTLVNGIRVHRVDLHHGDLIRIGPLLMRFEDAPAPDIGFASSLASQGVDANETQETSMLDELVGSIRTHRERERSAREQAEAHVREEWDKLLVVVEQLRAKISGDRRVLHFGIDRKAADVMIRIKRDANGPQKLITVALRHPDYRDQVLNGIWLIRTGEPERCLPDAQAVATELIREFAFLLA